MHQKHLLRFIKSKLKKRPHEVVIFRDGKYLTLQEVFESLQLTGCAGQGRLPARLCRCLLRCRSQPSSSLPHADGTLALLQDEPQRWLPQC